MGRMHQIPVVVSTGTDSAGTATTGPVNGYLVRFRLPNAATALVGTGATADFTLTQTNDGGTVFTVTNTAAPAMHIVSSNLSSQTGGTTAYAVGVGPVVQMGVPVDSPIQVVVAQGAVSGAGTVWLTVDGHAAQG